MGKTTRGEKYSDGIEFCNLNCKPFDWENEELAETIPEPEEPVYPDVLTEVPGLVIESDLTDDDDAVMEPAEPTFEEQAAAALANSGVVPENIPEIIGAGGKITGVDRDVFLSVQYRSTTYSITGLRG